MISMEYVNVRPLFPSKCRKKNSTTNSNGMIQREIGPVEEFTGPILVDTEAYMA